METVLVGVRNPLRWKLKPRTFNISYSVIDVILLTTVPMFTNRILKKFRESRNGENSKIVEHQGTFGVIKEIVA